MPAKRLLCLTACLAVVMSAHAQRALYFRPAAGLSFPMEHLIEKSPHPLFRYNNHNFYVAGGIEVLYRINDKVDFFTGFHSNVVNFSYRMHNIKRSLASTQWEFPLGLEWLIKDVWFHPMEKRPALFRRNDREYGYFFLALFRIKAITGLSTSVINGTNAFTSVQGPAYQFSEHTYQLHRRNYSVLGGINLQFYNRKRDKLHFTLLYNQGLRRVMEMEVKEITDGGSFSARLGSRGSYFATQFKIPLRLIAFDQL